MNGLDPKRMECLARAISAGSIRAAAESLGLEPSSVSRQIAQLEAALAIALIERSRRGVKPTEAGQLLLDYAKRQSGEFEALRSDFDALRGMRRGTLSLAVGEGFVGDLFGGALRSFSAKHPDIQFSVATGSSGDVVNAVLHDDAHLGFAFSPRRDSALKSMAQARQPLMLLAAPDHPAATLPEPIRAIDLDGLPCAVLNNGFGVTAILDAAEARLSVRFRAQIRTGSIAVLKNFVRSGMGATFLPGFVVVREIADGVMVAKRLEDPEFQLGEAHLLARRGRRLPQTALALLQHLARDMACFRPVDPADR